MNLKAKLTIAYALIVSIPLIIAFVVFSSELRGVINRNLENNQIASIEIIRESLDRMIENYNQDVTLLSSLSSLSNYLKQNDQSNLNSVISDFYTLIVQNDSYTQVRYIDENGMEVIRLNNESNNIEIVTPSELQDKSDRYYFQDAIKAKKGVVYISPLDLNVEEGEIQNIGTNAEPQYVPMLRIATPVFDENDNNRGIVIINQITNLHDIDNHAFSDDMELMLLNSDGFYLHNRDVSKEWGFMLGHEHNYFIEHPTHANKFFELSADNRFHDSDSGQIVYYNLIYPSGRKDVISSSLYEDELSVPQGIDYYWILINTVSDELLTQNFFQIIKQYIFVVLSIIIIMLLMIRYGIGFLINPIVQISMAAKVISKGEVLEIAGFERKDELGNLARSLNEMVKKLRLNQSIIEKEVNERTKDLEEMNKHLVGRELKMSELKRRIKELEK